MTLRNRSKFAKILLKKFKRKFVFINSTGKTLYTYLVRIRPHYFRIKFFIFVIFVIWIMTNLSMSRLFQLNFTKKNFFIRKFIHRDQKFDILFVDKNKMSCMKKIYSKTLRSDKCPALISTSFGLYLIV